MSIDPEVLAAQRIGRVRPGPKYTSAARYADRKQSIYFGQAIVQEIIDEAIRLDRSVSWVVQRSWVLARKQIAAMPTVPQLEDDQP